MASWVLTDTAKSEYESSWKIDGSQVSDAPSNFAIEKRTLRGGLSDGVDEIRVHNGAFQFSVLPTRGMGLWKAWLGDLEIGWASPVRGPVHPAFVPQTEDSGLGWLDGFDEWVCRCGAVSNGAPDFDDQGNVLYPLHGHIANLPATSVSVAVDGDAIQIRGVVHESRFHFHKLQLTTTITSRFNQPGLVVHDEIKNLSAGPGEMQMLYHCNFGHPLLGAGAEVVLAAETVVPRNAWAAEAIGHWPTYSEPVAGTEERVYFCKMFADAHDMTEAMLKNSDSSRGVSLTWNTRQLPCLSIWKNETALEDGYVTGIEPGTNFPNSRSFEAEQGRLVQLAGGATYEMQVGFEVHNTAQLVAAAESRIAEIRAGRTTRTMDRPQPSWCAP